MIRYTMFIKHIGVKLLGILQTVQGWVVAGLLFLMDFIAGHELAVGLVVFVTLMMLRGDYAADINNN